MRQNSVPESWRATSLGIRRIGASAGAGGLALIALFAAALAATLTSLPAVRNVQAFDSRTEDGRRRGAAGATGATGATGESTGGTPSRASSGAAGDAPLAAAQCRVRLHDDVTLASERGGILDDVVSEGTTIEPRQIVARLRDHLARAALAVTEREAENDIEVRFSRKATELAQMKYARAVDANKAAPGAVSDLELRELRLAAEKSLLQLEQAEHHFLIAGLKRDEQREALRTFRIESPLSGVVLEVLRKPGEVVREGEPILRLATTRRLRVEGYLALSEADAVQVGNVVEARIETDADGSSPRRPASVAPFVGRVAFVDVKLEPVSQKVKFVAEVANRKNGLRDGMMVTVSIDTSRVDTEFVARQEAARRKILEPSESKPGSAVRDRAVRPAAAHDDAPQEATHDRGLR